jgi:hypothetical protein
MSKIKSLNLLDNKGFWPEKASVIDAIKEILSLGGHVSQFPVRDFGNYRSPQWRDENNQLVPWQSVDWYVYDALDEERMQVDASQILHTLSTEPWRDKRLLGDHYDLLILEEDMYAPSEENGKSSSYCVGASKPFCAAVVSTHRVEHIWGLPYSCIKTEIMRQLCFMFGVPSRWRHDVEKGPDGIAYCKNKCILQRASKAPDDWERLSDDRLKRGPLCEFCQADLHQFFVTTRAEKN